MSNKNELQYTFLGRFVFVFTNDYISDTHMYDRELAINQGTGAKHMVKFSRVDLTLQMTIIFLDENRFEKNSRFILVSTEISPFS